MHILPLLLNSRIIIRISGDRVWYPLQENSDIFKKLFSQLFDRIFEKLRICIKMTTHLSLLIVQ